MQWPNRTLLLVEIKQEEVNPEEQWVLRPHKEKEVSNPQTVLERHKSQHRRRRLYAEQDSSESSDSECVSRGDEWKPSTASSPSPAEVNPGTLAPTVPSIFPTGDLKVATCFSIPTKTSDPTSPLEASTSAVHEYTCEFCGKAFLKISNLDQHVNGVHKNLRSFPCGICGFSFKYRGDLKSHVDNVHKNLRNFSCDICGHSFARKFALNEHINAVHKNLRNFPCDICGHYFQQKTGLHRHINTVHQNLRKFPCNICGQSFKDGGTLKTHVNAVHKNLRAFLCAICGRTFKHNSSLKKHLRHFHPEGTQEKQENPF